MCENLDLKDKMFKKAKYRWQIKSSNRSNQLMGLDGESDEEDFDSNNTSVHGIDMESVVLVSEALGRTPPQTRKRLRVDENELSGYNCNLTNEALSDTASAPRKISRLDTTNANGIISENLLMKSENEGVFRADTQNNYSNIHVLEDHDVVHDVQEMDIEVPRDANEEMVSSNVHVDLVSVHDNDFACELAGDSMTSTKTGAQSKDECDMLSDLGGDAKINVDPPTAGDFTKLKPRETDSDIQVGTASAKNTHDLNVVRKTEINQFDTLVCPNSLQQAQVNLPTSTPRRLTYLERWRCQHLAKAMVDNAINKTLEESGLSPNPQPIPTDTNQQSNLESEGVSHAIRMVGLRPRYSPSSMQRLNPIINRLTQVSENIFSANLQNRDRNRMPTEINPTVNTQRSPTPSPTHFFNETLGSSPESSISNDMGPTMTFPPEKVEPDSGSYRDSPFTHCTHGVDDRMECELCINNCPNQYSSSPADQHTNLYTTPAVLDNERNRNCVLPDVYTKESKMNVSNVCVTHTINSNACDDIGVNVAAGKNDQSIENVKGEDGAADDRSSNDSQGNLSTSFLLDTAVSFAINEKGLQLN